LFVSYFSCCCSCRRSAGPLLFILYLTKVISPLKMSSEVSSIVVCFLFDGSDKYNRMTLNAVNSFLSTTPHIKVGLLFPQNYDENIVVSQLTDPSRAAVRRFQNHFQSWNPTQHKLDIIKFSDEFTTIFWLDSDAIVYHDLTDLLLKFHTSPCKVAFMKDHVCYNPQFLNVWLDWRKISDPFIPQASFMGFKKEIMPTFFAAWEETWRKWIEPVPFLNYPDPVPSFPGSAFCTEQYALGMVLESDLLTRADVYELRRITFPLKGVTAPNSPTNSTNSSVSLDFNFLSYSGSERVSDQELGLLEDQFRSFSFPSSFSAETSWNTSWNETTSAQTSWGPETSFSFSSWASTYPEFSFSFSSWESLPTSFSGSAELYANTSFSGNFSFTSSFGSSVNSSFARGLWAPIDNIEGHIVHFYSAFYEQSQNWWQGNSTEVIPQINQYWDRRNQRPAYVVSPPNTHNGSRVSPPKQHTNSPPQQQNSNSPFNTTNNNNYNNNINYTNNTRYKNNEPGL